jgi:hypothetical protein
MSHILYVGHPAEWYSAAPQIYLVFFWCTVCGQPTSHGHDAEQIGGDPSIRWLETVVGLEQLAQVFSGTVSYNNSTTTWRNNIYVASYDL